MCTYYKQYNYIKYATNLKEEECFTLKMDNLFDIAYTNSLNMIDNYIYYL